MNLVFALPLILALGVALYAVRRILRGRAKRRARERRERAQRTGPRSFAPAKSKRSQMRTDDDPTTVMERITETKPPSTGPSTKPK